MITIYTDGACSGNPGKGGWGSLIIKNNNVSEYYGGENETTNNRMEMTAVIQALNICKEDKDISLYTDSKYIINGVNGWLSKWKTNNWKTSSKKDVKNKDLWIKLDQLLIDKCIKFNFVKGHSGDIYNEKADQLAKYGINN
tara:strand:- start:216 stop:638 length:423 start_codon:yes stop_codon:yes gene_type:complete